ncbi:MAG: NAD(P)H-hydrate dehydratase [Bacteroidales bacterium]|nr:NAD(P)H-hydrate dehydratase [Bacteroidales bacterium]MCB8998450.1 NAD(P)H-hydrate dehydratase [Bacteroidales bacterium]
MKILTSRQMQQLDRLTIENEPISSIKLMERASLRFCEWFRKNFDNSHKITIVAGPGNNGGDALAIARLLIERNYPVKVFMVSKISSLSADCSIMYDRLKDYNIPEVITDGCENFKPEAGDIVIDGIFGSGLNRPVEGETAKIIGRINEHPGRVISIDIPSGLLGEDNSGNVPENIIKADFTISFEFPFLSFFMTENEEYTGEVHVIPIGLDKKSADTIKSSYQTIDLAAVHQLIRTRKKNSHKGSYGNALIIAGKYGMMGAAVLAVKACVRGGAGLTTACIPRKGYDIMQISLPEALIKMGQSDEFIDILPELESFQAVACGPAIGKAAVTEKVLAELLKHCKVPLVLDADALNLLAEHPEWLEILPVNTILTPHPKEFDRLAGPSDNSYNRHLKQIDFARKYHSIVILKTANTIITFPDGKSYINTSGNAGMATGGSGDVLTGLLVSLLAQGYSRFEACLLSVYLHGLSADIALESSSMESVIPTDLIENLGKAFRRIHENE